jgi:anoctamin-10
LAPTILFVALVPRVLALYQAFASKLTNWENHAHESTHEASLTIKTFALSAIVAYLGLALSAFVYVPFGQFVMAFVQAYVAQNAKPGESGSTKRLFDSNILKTKNKIDPSREYRCPVSRILLHVHGAHTVFYKGLQNQMFAYTVTNQVINTLIEVVLPYVTRGVDDVKNGKGVGGLRGNKKRVVFEDEKADAKEERQFLEDVRHEVSLPEYSLFGMCHSTPSLVLVSNWIFRRLCGNGHPVWLRCIMVDDLAISSGYVISSPAL